jgi:hypothetical protein
MANIHNLAHLPIECHLPFMANVHVTANIGFQIAERNPIALWPSIMHRCRRMKGDEFEGKPAGSLKNLALR